MKSDYPDIDAEISFLMDQGISVHKSAEIVLRSKPNWFIQTPEGEYLFGIKENGFQDYHKDHDDKCDVFWVGGNPRWKRDIKEDDTTTVCLSCYSKIKTSGK